MKYDRNPNSQVFLFSGARKSHIGLAHPKVTEDNALIVEQQPPPEIPPIVDQKPLLPAVSIPISADLINQALESLQAQGKPLIGSIVKVGLGSDTSLSLHVDEALLAQLNSGQNINLVINSVDQSSTIPNQSPITCPLCDAFFLFEEEKTNHLLTVHNMRIEEAPTKTFEVTDDKVCQYCNKAFSKPSMLIRHMRVHTGRSILYLMETFYIANISKLTILYRRETIYLQNLFEIL